MVIEVREDFEKEFERELENCTARVRWGRKEMAGKRMPTSAGLNLWSPLCCEDYRCRPLFWWHRCRGRIAKKPVSKISQCQ